jgi:ElaB/YqjD/DUF883 family membrane-anchored ribosome-binding protein
LTSGLARREKFARGKFALALLGKNKYLALKYMSKQAEESNDMGSLAEDARALIAATADVAGEKVAEARKRLAAALESAKEMAGRVRDKAVQGAKVVDEAVHDHPYQAMAVAFSVGALAGYFAARRCSRNRE